MIHSSITKTGKKFYHVALMTPMEAKAFGAYRGMITRCYTKSSSGYRKYGSKGLGVCDRWRESFDVFVSDVGIPASPDLSIERLKNAIGYEPGNVKWGTVQEQHDNRRNTKWVPINGATKPASTWAREIGISDRTFWARIEAGMTGEELLRPTNFRIKKYPIGDGRYLTPKEIENEFKLTQSCVWLRISKGITGPALIAPPIPRGTYIRPKQQKKPLDSVNATA